MPNPMAIRRDCQGSNGAKIGAIEVAVETLELTSEDSKRNLSVW